MVLAALLRPCRHLISSNDTRQKIISHRVQTPDTVIHLMHIHTGYLEGSELGLLYCLFSLSLFPWRDQYVFHCQHRAALVFTQHIKLLKQMDGTVFYLQEGHGGDTTATIHPLVWRPSIASSVYMFWIRGFSLLLGSRCSGAGIDFDFDCI